MITKPEEHDTDRAGKRLLRGVLEKLGWVLNDVEEDYGIDSNVQVFDGAHPTGVWFHVQLKSSLHTAYSCEQLFISQGLSGDHARYYALEMRQPVALIHVDVARERVFWYFPQLDNDLTATLINSEAKSVTVRIPASQELPQAAPDLLLALDKVYLTLANRELISVSAQFFAESFRHLPDQDKLARAFQEKNDILKLERIRQLYGKQHFGEARSRANAVIADPDSNIETKFWAQVQLQAVDYHETLHAGKPQSELPKLILRHAKALQSLTRSGPKYLKFYALIARQAAELEITSHESFSLFLAFRQQLEAGSDPMMALGLLARRAATMRQVFVKYNRCLRLARYTTNYRDRWALGRALTNVVKALGSFMTVLRAEKLSAYEVAFSRSALQVCKLAAWISAETGDTEGIVLAILAALMTVHSEDSEAYRWAQEAVSGIADQVVRRDAELAIGRAAKRWRGEQVEGDYHGDTIWQIAQNIATGMGLDLTDENSPIVKQLRIAARDNSPERVLVHCEYLLVARGAIGPSARKIGRLFAIGTAGSKVVHCTLHDYHAEEKDLDTAYNHFKSVHCDSCQDAKPRSPNWHYNAEARQFERNNYSEFLDRFQGKPFGLRYTREDE